ncbi:patatin-like phospholipase family protein [Vibrio brasiliensis]|uniref:CBASS cGAMP-activated phospholipase n=1 Tax=Vibrio brasiliensis TaxID=170652 RepID=UPI001EFC616E|nr:CBASS cGAMP-activated phospholipase [Vibrio brasiliensis]MCG9649843.1 patatin-like phospholipase family protein [Vibrio brasiliensis]
MNNDPKTKLRVLSLNGGGVRGLYTISVLAELEHILAKGDESYSIAEHFDLIAGTSIGGLLALGLADGKTARELKSKMLEHASTIFPPRKYLPNFLWKTWKGFRAVLGHRYNGVQISKAVEDIVGEERKVRDLQRRILIPTVNVSTGKPLFVKTCHNPRFTRDDRLKLVDVARATSAAPTYFEPHYIEELNAYFVDGGLVANNPSYIAYHEAVTDLKEEFNIHADEQIYVLNIGTMASEFCINPELINSWAPGYLRLWGLGSTLVETVMNGNQWMHHFMTARALSKVNHVMLDDVVPDQQASIITLDNSRPEALKVLVARGKQKATEAIADSSLNLREIFFSDKAPKFVHPEDKKHAN